MRYPSLLNIDTEELVIHFTLSQNDLQLVMRARKNRLGLAVFLKSYQLLGYPPVEKKSIPGAIIKTLATQLEVPPSLFEGYIWKGIVWKRNLALIRKHLGFEVFSIDKHQQFVSSLGDNVWREYPKKKYFEFSISQFRASLIELPTQKEFERLIGSVWNDAHKKFYITVFSQIDLKQRERIDLLLSSKEAKKNYTWLKSPARKMGMKTLLSEIEKRSFIDEFRLSASLFNDFPLRPLEHMMNRARSEDVTLMKAHPEEVRYTLFAILALFRRREITDHIVTIFIELIRRISRKSETSLEKEVIKNIKKIYSKKKILYQMARVATETPEKTIRDAIFPKVSEEMLQRIVQEFESDGDDEYEVAKIKTMHRKYSYHYRQMLKPILGNITFKANNPAYGPLLEGIALICQYMDSKLKYYPPSKEISLKLITTNYWKDLIVTNSTDGTKISRVYFELLVLQKLERSLKCKEVWIEGAFKFRNPDEDLPSDWSVNRSEYYKKINIPLQASSFIEPIKEEMMKSLRLANNFFTNKNNEVYIYRSGKSEKGLFRIPKLQKRPERPILQEIKDHVVDRWGILYLLDVLLEADRQTNFTRSFYTSGQRQILTLEEVRQRLLLCIYSLGTNIELKKLYSGANVSCSYRDLLYFRARYLNPTTLREAIALVVNRILAIRNPHIWSNTTACASDGKQFQAWDQNLIADWHPHYKKSGVMVYWHVDSNSTCIYSKLKTCSSSEVAAMINGLVNHDTEMRIETNYVDSHGQSEVAFAFCKILGIDLNPRLKRIKYERLFLPDKEIASSLNNLTSVISRPIRWDIIYEQYDEMIKYVTAVVNGTGPTESILRRFSSVNRGHPTYKAFIELGKSVKTEFLCRYLMDLNLRTEIHEGLNTVENWNSANSFICYGRRTEFQSNDPLMQEMTMLCLHLLQNSVILSNTIMMDRMIKKNNLIEKLSYEDRKALTPLFTSNINPYGDFVLDMSKPSFLEVA